MINTAHMMMRTTLLATLVSAAFTSTPAIADANLRVNASATDNSKSSGEVFARATPSEPANTTKGYLLVGATISEDSDDSLRFFQLELGRRIGDGPGFVRAAFATASDGDVSINQGRGGLEFRTEARDIRVFGGLDVGWWTFEVDWIGSISAMAVTPRFGVEVGNKLFVRGTVEAALFVNDGGQVLMLGLGAGVRL